MYFFSCHLKLFWVHKESRNTSFAFPSSTWEHKECPCSGWSPGAKRGLFIDTAAAHTRPGAQLQALRVAGPPREPHRTVMSSTSFSAKISKNSFEDFSQHLCLSFFFFLLFLFVFADWALSWQSSNTYCLYPHPTLFSRMESTEKCEVVIQHFNGKYLKTPPGLPGKSSHHYHNLKFTEECRIQKCWNLCWEWLMLLALLRGHTTTLLEDYPLWPIEASSLLNFVLFKHLCLTAVNLSTYKNHVLLLCFFPFICIYCAWFFSS